MKRCQSKKKEEKISVSIEIQILYCNEFERFKEIFFLQTSGLQPRKQPCHLTDINNHAKQNKFHIA